MADNDSEPRQRQGVGAAGRAAAGGGVMTTTETTISDLPAALDEIDRLRAQIERLVAVHNEEFLASAARFSALIAERDLLQKMVDEYRWQRP